MIRLLKHQLQLIRIKFLFSRYCIAAIGLAEAVLLPIVFVSDDYVSIEYFKNIISFAPFLLLGINSGYINQFYANNNDYARTLILATFGLSAVYGIVVATLFKNHFLSLAIISMLIPYGIEKVLVVRGFFLYSILFKGIQSIIVIASLLTTCGLMECSGINVQKLYAISVFVGTFIWTVSLPFAIGCKTNLLYKYFDFSELIKLLKFGWLISLQSAIVLLLFFVDRWLILHHFPESAKAFSFGYTVAFVFIFGINTISFTLQKDLGEHFKNFDYERISRAIKSIFMIYIVGIFLLLLSFVAIHLASFDVKYSGYEAYAISIYITVGLYYSVASTSVLASYNKNFYGPLGYLIVGSIVCLIVTYFLTLKFPCPLALTTKTGLILAAITYISNKKYSPSFT